MIAKLGPRDLDILNYTLLLGSPVALWVLIDLGILKGTQGPTATAPILVPAKPALSFRCRFPAHAGGRLEHFAAQDAMHISPSRSLPFGFTRDGARVKPGQREGTRMDFKYLFTSFDGRINRAKYWAGIVILGIINIVLSFIVVEIFGLRFSWRGPRHAS